MSKTHRIVGYRGFVIKVKEFSKGYYEWVLVRPEGRVYDPTSYGTVAGALRQGAHAVDRIIEHEKANEHIRVFTRPITRRQRRISETYFRKAR